MSQVSVILQSHVHNDRSSGKNIFNVAHTANKKKQITYSLVLAFSGTSTFPYMMNIL